MEGFLRFFFILVNRIVFGMLGSWIRRSFFNVPYKKAYKKKSSDFDVIDIEDFKNRLVGLAAVAIVVFLLTLLF